MPILDIIINKWKRTLNVGEKKLVGWETRDLRSDKVRCTLSFLFVLYLKHELKKSAINGKRQKNILMEACFFQARKRAI